LPDAHLLTRPQGRTALLVAALGGHLEVARALRERGASAEVKTEVRATTELFASG